MEAGYAKVPVVAPVPAPPAARIIKDTKGEKLLCRLVLRSSLASVIDVLCWWCRVRRRVQGAVQAALAAERVLSSLHHLLQRLQVRASGDLWPHGAVRQVLHRLEDAREPDQVPLSAAFFATGCCSSRLSFRHQEARRSLCTFGPVLIETRVFVSCFRYPGGE